MDHPRDCQSIRDAVVSRPTVWAASAHLFRRGMGRQDREGSGRGDGRRKERGERGDRRLNFFSKHAGRPGLEIANPPAIRGARIYLGEFALMRF